MSAVATPADTAWWALLERCQHNVERAKGFWYRSRDLMALAPHPPTTEGLEEYKNEDELKNAVIKALRKRGFIAYHSDSGSKSQTNRARAGRPPPGWPDVTCLASGGRTLFFETKTDEGVTSVVQRDMHSKLGRLGHSVYVVRSVAEALGVFEQARGIL